MIESIIEGFPNYKINSNCKVFSRYKYKTNIVTTEWREVKHVLDTGVGYKLITVVHNGMRKNKHIHRLMALAFIPNPSNKPCVNHIDGNKQNNILSNLEWCTHKENAQHAVKTGLCDNNRKKQEVAILQLKHGKVITEHVSLHEAGRSTSIAWQNISKVVRGLRKSAGGFQWEYK